MNLRFCLLGFPIALLACSGSSNPGGPTDGGGTTEDSGSPANGNDAGGNNGLDGSTSKDSGQSAGDSGSAKDSGSGGQTDSGGGGDSGQGTGDSGGGGHAIKTVFVIVMENTNWSTIKGSASAPYINGLLPQASYCSAYYDNPAAVHPSEPNYIWIESGSNLGFTTDDDPSPSHDQTTTSHFVTQLASAGVSWKSYQEDLASGHCGTVSNGLYAAKHNPMVFFTDISGSPPSDTNAGCIQHVRPYTELAGDLSGGTVAQYNFITPNLCDDMHNTIGCASLDAVKNGDTWLAQNVPPILASNAYKDGGVLFITWDESENGESPIGMIVLSPLAKGGGYVSATKYYHSSLLRTEEEIFGVSPFLNDAANQPDLSDLFTTFP